MGWKAIDPPLQHWNIASRVLQLIKEMANRQNIALLLLLNQHQSHFNGNSDAITYLQ
jgi:N-acetylglutamate synthase-like GNAT family acetyltransferase